MNVLLEELREICGDHNVLLDESIRATYETDWTGRWKGQAWAVVRPGTTKEVEQTVRTCIRNGVSLVVRGGGTGLVGGAVPTSDGTQIVLSTERLKGIEIDPVSGTGFVGAGVTLQELNIVANQHGLQFAVDLGSRGSCTIGGMVATNAGGLRMLRWGDTARQLLGAEVVTGYGDVLTRMAGLAKDNTGIRWHEILPGSEGTLAVICRVAVRLIPVPKARAVAWFPVKDAKDAIRVAGLARRNGAVSAVEYIEANGIALVAELIERKPPTSGAAVIVEASTTVGNPVEALAELSHTIGAADNATCVDGPRAEELWDWRDRHTEAIAHAGIPAKCDVSVPLSTWAEFHDRVPEVLRELDSRLWCVRFGHIADGNLHVNILHKSGESPPEAADNAVWTLAASLGGSVSAEHGIGVAKAKWLHLSRSKTELDAVERLRLAWDPSNILAPHLLRTPDDTSDETES